MTPIHNILTNKRYCYCIHLLHGSEQLNYGRKLSKKITTWQLYKMVYLLSTNAKLLIVLKNTDVTINNYICLLLRSKSLSFTAAFEGTTCKRTVSEINNLATFGTTLLLRKLDWRNRKCLHRVTFLLRYSTSDKHIQLRAKFAKKVIKFRSLS